jgi:hypothetical protein
LKQPNKQTNQNKTAIDPTAASDDDGNGLLILNKRRSRPNYMDRLQTSGELQDKTSFIDPSTGVGLLKGCSLDYLLL